MVKLKPKSDREREISIVSDRHFRFKHLLLFILGSTLVHGLIFLLLVKYKATKLPVEETASEPIDFVVVPPEEETEPPPETNNRANENSVAKSDIPPEPVPSPETADELISTPDPTPEVAKPIPKPIATPEPTPEVAKPTPEPEPESSPAPEPTPPANQTISGSDAPIASPEPVEEPVAARLPPEPSNPAGSAADLLGGDYQKTLANSGDAFFSPEALTHKTVLNTNQIDALQDLDLSEYFARVQQQIDRTEKPVLNQRYTAVLIVDIQKDGQITGFKIKNRSGPEEYDRRFIERFREMSPFPPLPPEFPLEALQDVPINIYIE